MSGWAFVFISAAGAARLVRRGVPAGEVCDPCVLCAVDVDAARAAEAVEGIAVGADGIEERRRVTARGSAVGGVRQLGELPEMAPVVAGLCRPPVREARQGAIGRGGATGGGACVARRF